MIILRLGALNCSPSTRQRVEVAEPGSNSLGSAYTPEFPRRPLAGNLVNKAKVSFLPQSLIL